MQTQPNSTKTFAGSDYDHDRDSPRLTSQFDVIFNLMKDGKWRTIRQIEGITGYPQNSIQSQLRHARKERFGAHTVEKDYKGNGIYFYRLIVNTDIQRKLF